MKNITLKTMTMCNFRGCTKQVTNFNGDITIISGKNGLGKSRHVDAFLWCLTGKDSQNRKDYEIKSRNTDAETTAKVDASVEIKLSVDGVESTYKRVLVEKWETPKGTTEEVYRGNETKCYVDDIPVSVTEYAKRVNNLIDSETFKLLTNPFYFTEILDWKARRAILAGMCNVTNEMVANGDEKLTHLLADMNGKNEEDFKKWLSAQIAPLKNKPQEIDIRIKQIREDMPGEENWQSLREELELIEDDTDIVQAQIASLADTSSAYVSRKADLEGMIYKYTGEIKDLVRNEERKLNDEYYKKQEEYVALMAERNAVEFRLKSMEEAVERERENVDKSASCLESLVSDKMQYATKYDQLKACEGTCPTCGGAMTEELAGKELPNVVAKIDSINEQIERVNSIIEDAKNNIIKNESAIADCKDKLADMVTLEKPVLAVVDKDNIRGMKTLTKSLEKAQKDLDKLVAGNVDTQNTELKSRLRELKAKATDIRVRLANETRIAELNERIVELQAEAKGVVVERAKYERMQYLLMQLQYGKAKMLQEQVNSMFANVQFKMFTTTIEGNLVETCIPLINGAYYDSANSASKLNAGLDIINTLSKVYKCVAPIWIDNAEGVNKIARTKSQQIRLVVTTEDTLNIQ